MLIVQPRILTSCCSWVAQPGRSILRRTYPCRVTFPTYRRALSITQKPCLRGAVNCLSTASSSSGSRILRTREPSVAASPTVKPVLQPMPMPANENTVPLLLEDNALRTAEGVQFLEALPACMFRSNPITETGILLGAVSEAGSVSQLDVPLGQLSVRRFLACARSKLWWMTPEWGTDVTHLPPETQFLLMELREGGPYVIMLPLIDDGFRATLRKYSWRRNSQTMGLRIESGADTVKGSRWEHVLFIAASHDPYELVEHAVANAAKISGGALPLSKKQLPASLDLFGWCTWDAFYSTVSAKGLREGVSSLRSGGVPPGLLIIDDGWQLTDVDQPMAKPPVSQIVDNVPNMPKQIKSAADDSAEEFYKGEAAVLAEAVKDLPAGTSMGTTMPTLSGVGPAPHHPIENVNKPKELEPTDASPRQEVSLFVMLLQKIVGWMIGLGTAAVLLVYQYVVEPAPAGSFPVRFFEWLVTGPLRGAMLAFYATASDFTRRLVSIQANGKFADINTGPDEDWKSKAARLDLVVANMKNSYGVKYVYCWHGLPAYWAGVMPDSEMGALYNAKIRFAKPTPGVLEIEPSMAWNPAVLAGVGVVDEPGNLYRDMHEYLFKSGVDGVKVDCQAGVGLIGSAMGGGPNLSAKFHEALEDSARMYFKGNHLINCMCHSTENLYRMTRSAVARACDDFYPRDAASSLPHIGACAFNSLFLSALVQPDWDMFQSKHPAAELHGMARAVSGGAVYVSDRPGEHDFALLKKLVLPDGSVLRGSVPGRPSRECIFDDVLRDGKSLLKVWTLSTLGGVLGVFNVQGSSWDRVRRRFWTHQRRVPDLSADVKAADVDSFHSLSGPFVAFQHSTAKLHVLKDASETLPITLANSKADIFTYVPIMEAPGLRYAPVGLMDMYNSSGAVLSCSWKEDELKPYLRAETAQLAGEVAPNGRNAAPASSTAVVVNLKVKGCGRFLLWCDRAPVTLVVDGVHLRETYSQEEGCLIFTVPATETLECDVHAVFADVTAA